MKHLVVLVGLPGSGKSTLCQKDEYQNYIRISQDDQGKEGYKRLFQVGLMQETNLIIDRCNFNKEQRNRYLIPAKKAGYKTTIIYVKIPPEECIARINNRPEHPTLPASSGKAKDVVMMFHNMFVEPSKDEADEVIVI